MVRRYFSMVPKKYPFEETLLCKAVGYGVKRSKTHVYKIDSYLSIMSSTESRTMD